MMKAPPTSVLPRVRRRTRADQSGFREQVLDSARAIFADEGLEALTMRRLSETVGVAPMSLYRYFPSKAHLLRHLWDDLLMTSLAAAEQAACQPAEPCARPGAFIGGFMTHWLRHPDSYLLVFTTSHERPAAGAGLAPFVEQRGMRLHFDAARRLVDDCLGPAGGHGDDRARLVELMFCRAFGFLHPVLYFVSFPWRNVDAMQREIVDEITARRTALSLAPTGHVPPA